MTGSELNQTTALALLVSYGAYVYQKAHIDGLHFVLRDPRTGRSETINFTPI